MSFEVAPDQSLLDAAFGASLNLPHSCKGGNCGSCRARLLEGEIRYPNGRPLGLSEAEEAEGFVLLCQSYACSDVTIEVTQITSPNQSLIKRLPARIERTHALSHDVMGLFLRLPAAEEFRFEAGQYIDIMLPRGRRRSFSIASPPHDSRLLELHVRRVSGGEFSATLFNDGGRSSLLSIEGPLGQFWYRPAAAPMLLVGGGTGLAPLLSMMRHVVENGIERDMTLYWGVRSERDLYAQAVLQDLAARAAAQGAASLSYVPVLSEPTPDWRGRRGLVHQAVIEDIEHLEHYDVYAAGPPAMIAAVRREFKLRGAAEDRLFFDSFDYAPDVPLRQRSSADTKS
ncbi:MAG TPA: 2Fe-2S iron-sulfur cluster-binding protein [Steroidobacteraceae bacterium]|nr:2Fe-2S iron-sulfur cluster-binding protein [Steroidobacteraceae bacterium]